jgi:Tol biopolymer transport system component
MKRIQLALWAALFGGMASAFAQAGSEILLFDLKVKKSKVVLSNPVNITNHPGYDNQPYFDVEEPVVYYSSFNDDGRSDILAYNFRAKKRANITTTFEREYSPTLTPDKRYLSCIVQRDDGTQDLAKYPVEGGDAIVLINALKVGYHVWADDSHLALFVLEAEEKNSLHFLRLPTKQDTIVASNIGRSLHKIPGERSISFIQRGDKDSQVMRFNYESMKVSPVTSTISNGDHVTWTPTGLLLTSDGAKLFYFDPHHHHKGWRPVDVESGGELLKGVTRLAVNADGTRIAVVIAE